MKENRSEDGLLAGKTGFFRIPARSLRRAMLRNAFRAASHHRLFMLVLSLYFTVLLVFLVVYALIELENVVLSNSTQTALFILFVGGLGFLNVVSFRNFIFSKRIEKQMIEAIATVTDRWVQAMRNEEGCLYRFFIAYQVDGKRQIKEEVDDQTFHALKPGDDVKVLLLPHNNRYARLA